MITDYTHASSSLKRAPSIDDEQQEIIEVSVEISAERRR
jgi:hypothetical protein